MTFLNPLVLIGLAAAAIPLLIHLLNRRKLRTVDFSSLRFLRELQQTSLRRLKFRQILLLIVRTLLVCSLVLAFARPVLRGSLGALLGGKAENAMALILDDSPSMAVRNERGRLFDQARSAALTILQQGQPEDRVTLLPLSISDRADPPPSPSDPPSVRASLGTLTSTERSVPFLRALRSALRAMEASNRANREIFLVTDGQASAFRMEGEAPDSGGTDPGATRVYLVLVPSGVEANTGILSIELASRILSAGRPVLLNATLFNAATSEVRGAMVDVFLEGTRVAQHSIDLPPRTRVTLPFSVVPPRRGLLQGYLHMEDDPFEADNRRYFVLQLSARLRVGLAGSSEADVRYLAAALTLEGDSTLASGISVDRLDQGKLATADLESYDVLILAGVAPGTTLEADRIAAYVRAGHGLILFPAASAGAVQSGTALLPALGIPPVAERPGLLAPVGDPDTLRSYESFGRVDLTHPLLSGLFEIPPGQARRTPVFESPRIWKALAIRPGATGRQIIELGSGDPFLAEFASGEGRVLLCAVDAGRAWSDFPVRGIFAPLLHRTVLYLARGQRGNAQPVVGDRLTLTARRVAGGVDRKYLVRSPAGLDEPVTGKYLASTGELIFEPAPPLESGVYTLGVPGRSGSALEELDAVAVGLDPRESDLRSVAPDSLAPFWKVLGIPADRVTVLEAREGFDRVVQQSRFGTELWNLFALLALLLLGAEMFLAGPWRRGESAGGEGSTT